MKKLTQYIQEKLHPAKYNKEISDPSLFEEDEKETLEAVRYIGRFLARYECREDAKDYINGEKELDQDFYKKYIKDIERLLNNDKPFNWEWVYSKEISNKISKFLVDLYNDIAQTDDKDDFNINILRGMDEIQ